MECSLEKADWMCETCCDGCEHAVYYEEDKPNFNGGLRIKPADNVQVYENGRPAKTVRVRVRVTRVIPVLDDESHD